MGNIFRFATLALMLGLHNLALASDVPIAGLNPYERPAGAPVITSYDKAGDWYTKALTGVSQPYPGSLRFLEDQGPWNTPFNKPGMTGPYDIRGWHKPTGVTSDR